MHVSLLQRVTLLVWAGLFEGVGHKVTAKIDRLHTSEPWTSSILAHSKISDQEIDDSRLVKRVRLRQRPLQVSLSLVDLLFLLQVLDLFASVLR